MIGRAASVVLLLALAGCDRGEPRTPVRIPGDLTAPREGFRLPVRGRWRVHSTHYGRDDDQAWAVDLVKDEPLPEPRSPLEDYPSYGEPVVADAPGRVVIAADGIPDNPQGVRNRYDMHGNYVVIDHGDGTFSLFAHLVPSSLRVQVGDRVTAGQVIGLVGNSGHTSMPHLHYQVMDAAHAHQAEGLPVPHLPYEKNGEPTTERMKKGDRIEAIR